MIVYQALERVTSILEKNKIILDELTRFASTQRELNHELTTTVRMQSNVISLLEKKVDVLEKEMSTLKRQVSTQ